MQQKETFGERLSRIRDDRGLSRQQVADGLEISRASLEYYEKGKRKPDIDTLLKISEYFEVTCDYLLKGVKTENVSVNRMTGLSDKAIQVLNTIAQQKEGELIPDHFMYKEEIIAEESIINDIPEELLEQKKKDYEDLCKRLYNKTGEQWNIPFDEWAFQEERERLDLYRTQCKEEATVVLDTLNYLISQEKFFDFMKMIYMYLFANIDESKGTLTGVVSQSLFSDNSFVIQLNKELLNESFLLKVNSYLNEWRDRGKVKVFDLEMWKDNIWDDWDEVKPYANNPEEE